MFDWVVESRGKMLRPYEVLLHTPGLAQPAAELGHQIRYEGTLEDHDRELAIITTAMVHECGFEWDSHLGLARDAGVSEDTIIFLQTDGGSLDGRDELIVGFVRELCADSDVSDDRLDAATKRSVTTVSWSCVPSSATTRSWPTSCESPEPADLHVVDVHAHVAPATRFDAMRAISPDTTPEVRDEGDFVFFHYPNGTVNGPVPRAVVDIEARLADMSKTGVSHQVLSARPQMFTYESPGRSPPTSPISRTRALSRSPAPIRRSSARSSRSRCRTPIGRWPRWNIGPHILKCVER